MIRIDASFGDVEICAVSKFFALAKESRGKDGSKQFYFEQKYQLDFWNNISSLYLGEVIIFTERHTCSVCVVLECANEAKSFVLTAINPIGAEIKIDAHNILEVVLYDSSLGQNDYWTCSIKPGSNELAYECLGNVTIDKSDLRVTKWGVRSMNEVFFHCPRVMGQLSSRQHHFWFRCSSYTVNQLYKGNPGVYNIGTLHFEGNSSISTLKTHYDVNVRVRVKDRNKGKLYQPLLLPRLDVSQTPVYSTIGPHLPMFRHFPSHRVMDDPRKFYREVTLTRKENTGFWY